MQHTNCERCHTGADGDESVPEHDVAGESEWQHWQASYSARRRKTFTAIVEALKKRLMPLL